MNRQELILKIISLYPDTFREDRPEHVQAWVEMYEKAIHKDWDMDKLMYLFSTQYKSTVVPPAPSFFFEFRTSVKPEPKPKEPEPPPTPEEIKAREEAMLKFKEQMEKLQKKWSINNLK